MMMSAGDQSSGLGFRELLDGAGGFNMGPLVCLGGVYVGVSLHVTVMMMM